MNHLRITGEIVTQIKQNTNRKKGCLESHCIVAAPFEHPYPEAAQFERADDYRAWLRTYFVGDEISDWVMDNLDVGSHVEIRKGFMQTWANKMYRVIGREVDVERCGDEPPEDYEPWNEGYFSGSVFMESEPIERGGISVMRFLMKALPDFHIPDNVYNTVFTAECYAETAEKAIKMQEKGKWKGAQIDAMTGVFSPYKNRQNRYTFDLLVKEMKF